MSNKQIQKIRKQAQLDLIKMEIGCVVIVTTLITFLINSEIFVM